MAIDVHILYGLIPPMLISLAFITPMLGLFVNSRRFFHVYAAIVIAITVALATLISVKVHREDGVALYPFGGWPPPIGIAYIIDKLNATLAVVAVVTILASVVASVSYFDKHKTSTLSYIYTAIIGFTAGAIGVLYTGDIFNLFVMMEVMCISLYVMTSFHRTKPEAVEATIKYSFVSIIALIFYFFSTLLIYGGYQTLNMADLAIKARGGIPGLISGGYFDSDIYMSTVIAMSIIVWVFTLESALVPNHFWLPDAISEAPTPISAMLPAAEMVSIYVIIRYLFTIFGPDSVLAQHSARTVIFYALLVLGAIASVVGGIMMALQKDAKRLLGYSSVSHIGFIYIAIGLAGLSPNARLPLMAALFHMINYVLTSSLLFLAIGSLEKAVGSRDIDVLVGLGRVAPIAGMSIVLGVLNLIGVPPFGGFFSKLMIYQAALEVSQPWAAAVVIAATAITVMGYTKLVIVALGPRSKELKVRESYAFSIPSIALALAVLVLGLLLPLGLYSYLEELALTSTNYRDYVQVFLKYMYNLLGG